MNRWAKGEKVPTPEVFMPFVSYLLGIVNAPENDEKISHDVSAKLREELKGDTSLENTRVVPKKGIDKDLVL